MDLSRGKSQLEVASRQSERLVGVNAPASLFSLCDYFFFSYLHFSRRLLISFWIVQVG